MWPWIRWATCLAAIVTPASEPDRGQVATLCEWVQQVTGQRVEVACADQGYTGEEAEYAAAVHDIALQVVLLAVIAPGTPQTLWG
ncbi:hypothetical protein [Hymenobacter sp. APR13]|uniref:hypothetical protein n=1 Tax=Hymenobacter sp. APR13 TaxID=1356852 RepID=UPI0006937B03|nr:hypothetical protein [Hymenobacter sp. APR13]